MAYYVVIRGPLGIGKTTVAKKLAAVLRAEYISIDSVLEKNNLDKVVGSHVPSKNFIKANEIVMPGAKRKLSRGEIIVFDGNFYLKEQIRHLIRSLKAPHYAFTLKAPLKVCVDRDSRRKRKYGKEATEAVYNLVAKFDYGTVVDTANKTSAEVAKEILVHLPKAH